MENTELSVPLIHPHTLQTHFWLHYTTEQGTYFFWGCAQPYPKLEKPKCVLSRQ